MADVNRHLPSGPGQAQESGFWSIPGTQRETVREAHGLFPVLFPSLWGPLGPDLRAQKVLWEQLGTGLG